MSEERKERERARMRMRGYLRRLGIWNLWVSQASRLKIANFFAKSTFFQFLSPQIELLLSSTCGKGTLQRITTVECLQALWSTLMGEICFG
jgi:hypothetical protein